MELFFKKALAVAFLATISLSCEEALEEELFYDVSSGDFFKSDEDAEKAVEALYVKLRADESVTDGNGTRENWGVFTYGNGSISNMQLLQTDEVWIRWGLHAIVRDFTLTPSNLGPYEPAFADLFEGIFLANNILVNLEGNTDVSKPVRDRVLGEAYFGRALFYSTALSLFGNLPLVTEPETDPFNLPKQVPPDTIVALVISDLENAAELLPESYPLELYGKFTKGAAYAWLARFQLNQKNWEEAEEAARKVLKLNYSLSANYQDIFSVENQGNPEIILTIPCKAQPGIGNTMIAHTAEPDHPATGWGGHRANAAFYDSFDPQDGRRAFLVREYTSTINGAKKVIDDGRSMILKYEPDPNESGAWAGNDIVMHRLGEVYLTLAEALNELNGPNQESIDLINDLRDRAFENDPAKRIKLADFPTKEGLRDRILDERSWELYAENYRRADLIRHGKFISKARERGISNAQPHHVLYPIPQSEMDLNPNLVQNGGY